MSFGDPFDLSTLVFHKPDLNPATAFLHQWSQSDYARLEQLLASDNPLVQPTGPTQPLLGDDSLHSVVKSRIRYTIFANHPLRVIKLPDMKLIERSAVVDYLVKTKLKNVVQEVGQRSNRFVTDIYSWQRMRDSAIDEWVEDITKFAILSHTWEGDELNYQDFHQESGSHKQGYKKLKKFCTTAHEDYGVEFAWADTVCIDKSSSAELDESIRSMFAWYHNAHVCIVYVGQTCTLLDLAADRWFTRGWTLQELLAPSRLKFYNKDWYPLTDFRNDKISDEDVKTLPGRTYSIQSRLLGKAISTATGIDMDLLHGFKPGFTDPPLPQRMRWVAQRVTTRAEDKSYCMMGIFGVSMVVAYGEGPERAFFRLFQAILEVGYAREWFLWGGKALPSHIHPSRMIPSGPGCYLSSKLQMDHQDHDAVGLGPLDEPLSLTNIGLPIRLLVVPAHIDHGPSNTDSAYYRLSDIHISCPLSDDIVTVKGIPCKWHDRPIATTDEYALGIINLNLEMDDIPRPNDMYAILLRRTVRPALRLGPKKRWFHSKWERWETDKVIIFRCNDEFRRMDLKDWSVQLQVWWERYDGMEDLPMIGMQMLYL